MFKTQLEDVKITFGQKTILQEALRVFKQLFNPFPITKRIRDDYGTIGLKMGDSYLLAKRSTFGNVVSVHKKIWDEAKKHKRIIIIYLQNSGYFYRFDPAEIKETSINERGGIKMVNFGIREGKNLMRLKAAKRKVERVVEKNDDYYKKFSELCL